MGVTSRAPVAQVRFHPDAYRFVFEALHFTQQRLERSPSSEHDGEAAHITGQELVQGARELALQRYGLMSKLVFQHWGIRGTSDFGRIVFELIERGEMRKTERDQLSDFFNVYDFDNALDRDYVIDTTNAFVSRK